jgi:AcrR family transcriptional regulator
VFNKAFSMGRPAKHSQDDVVRMVVDAAEAMARQEGLRGLSLRKIAAEIGYVPGSLYNLIGDLDAIILHLNARTLERLSEYLKTRIDPAKSAVENAFAVAEGYLDFVMAEPLLWGLILEHRLLPGAETPAWFMQALSATTDLVEDVLRPLIADEAERRLAVVSLWAALHGIASLATSGKLWAVHEADPHAMARQLVARFLGVAAPRPQPSEAAAKAKTTPATRKRTPAS